MQPHFRRLNTLLIMAAIALPAIALAACGAAQLPAEVSQATAVMGTVTSLDRAVLDPNAVVTVELAQASADGTVETVLYRQTINPQGQQPPFPFALPYAATAIDQTRSYLVIATVEVNGAVVYASQPAVPVITNGAPTSNVEVFISPVTASAAGGLLTGAVTYLEPMALDPAAVVEIELQDASSGVPVVIASQQVNAEGRQVPIPFELAYDVAAIDPAKTYLLNARIVSGGVATFVSQTGVPVLTNGAPTSAVEVVVNPVAVATAGTIRGSVTTPQPPEALAAGAVLQVELREPALADAPATSTLEVPLDGLAFPISFELPYDPAGIAGDRMYAVAARILSGSRLLYATLAPVPVLTGGAPGSDIVVPVAVVPDPAGGVLRFTVSGDAPMSWPPGSAAYLNAEIREALVADAPAVATTVVPLAGLTLPVAFELGYDAAGIDPDKDYIFDAWIVDNNQLVYASGGTGTPILTKSAPANDVALALTHQVISDAPPGGTLTGVITSDNPGPLDATATYFIDLREAGSTGEPIVTISAVLGGQQFPIPFEVPYDPAAIDPAKDYVVGARILLGETVLYASQVGTPVLTKGAPVSDVTVTLPQLIGDAPPGGTLTGVITSDNPGPLDATAAYFIDLREAGSTGEPMVTISGTLAGQQFPIPFEVPFNPATIDPAKDYVIGARILLGNTVLYASQVGVPVLTKGAPATGVTVSIPRAQ